MGYNPDFGDSDSAPLLKSISGLIKISQFLCLSVLQGSAETLFRWCGKINHILIAQSLTFVPKIIQIRKCFLKLQLKMSRVFLRHSVHKTWHVCLLTLTTSNKTSVVNNYRNLIDECKFNTIQCTPSSFCALVFHNRLEDHKTYTHVETPDELL